MEPNGRFSIRSAYELLTRPINPKPEASWDLVWKWKGPARVQFFLWLVAHEKLLTNLERKRRLLCNDSGCARCGQPEESVLHVVRDCPFAASTWDVLNFPRSDPIRTVAAVDDWLRLVLKHDKSLDIGVLCWYLWKARNEWIFLGTQHSSESIAAKSASWTDIIRSALCSDAVPGIMRPRKAQVDIGWVHGPIGWAVLNTDGSVLPQSNSAAAGGLVRDEFGCCLAAFSGNLGRCSITRAELRGLIVGLDLAWEVGIRKLVARVDSTTVINLINAEEEPSHQHSGEINTLRRLLRQDWEVLLSHTYREGNRAADYLASLGHSLPLGTHRVPLSDCNLGYFLRLDCMGITEPRLIIVN
ncbi:Putative ribonuclease H protein At1g65750 [Linum perenne]